jgi:hypothetical protein
MNRRANTARDNPTRVPNSPTVQDRSGWVWMARSALPTAGSCKATAQRGASPFREANQARRICTSSTSSSAGSSTPLPARAPPRRLRRREDRSRAVGRDCRPGRGRRRAGRASAPVVRAAIDAGRHYVDTAGEQPYVASVFATHGAAAERAGVSVVPAANDGCLPVDLLTHLVAAGDDVEQISTLHLIDGDTGMSRGSLRSLLTVLGTQPDKRSCGTAGRAAVPHVRGGHDPAARNRAPRCRIRQRQPRREARHATRTGADRQPCPTGRTRTPAAANGSGTPSTPCWPTEPTAPQSWRVATRTAPPRSSRWRAPAG